MYDYNNKGNRKAKGKVKETDPTWSQIFLFPVTGSESCSQTTIQSPEHTKPISNTLFWMLLARLISVHVHCHLQATSALTVAHCLNSEF